MTNWAIRCERTALKSGRAEIGPTTRRPSFTPGERWIAFERSPAGLLFLACGTFESVHIVQLPEEPASRGEEPRVYFLAQLGLRIDDDFESPRNLDDFAYSLRKVYSYDSPERHFRLPYVRLDGQDYECLAEGEVFWTRTAFGHFANALPPAKLREFLCWAGSQEPSCAFARGPLDKAWPLLETFISDQYLALVPLLSHIVRFSSQLRGSVDDEPGISHIALEDPDDNTSFDVDEQAGAFEGFGHAMHGETDEPLLATLDVRIKENAKSEAALSKAFLEDPWPLLMTRS